MQTKFQVLLIGGLCCCIPAVVFFATGGTHDKAQYRATVWPLTTVYGGATATLQPETPPLEVGDQVLLLSVDRGPKDTRKAITPKIQIVMPMPDEMMTAPIDLTQSTKLAGTYRVKTHFGMAGNWRMDLDASNKLPTLHFYFTVPPKS